MSRYVHLSAVLLLSTLLGFFLSACTTSSVTSDDRPNIVLYLLDDAGYSDFSTFGGEISTPTISEMAREGATITRFYTAARCSPTRAGILTGRYPHAVGMADIANGQKFETQLRAYRAQLPLNVPLISEMLQASGYRTFMQGKWHLGRVPHGENADAVAHSGVVAPNQRGFDDFFGVLGAQAPPIPGDSPWSPYMHNGQRLVTTPNWYSVNGLNTHTLHAMAAQFEKSASQPFFLYVASQAPHLPLDAPAALIKKYEQVYSQPLETIWQKRIGGLKDAGLLSKTLTLTPPIFQQKKREKILRFAAKRAAMLESADAELARIIALLKKHKKLDNTLIIIASDNGASSETAALTNAPFRGSKAQLWEGGVLSPMIVRWPAGHVTKNSTVHTPVSYLDIMPTLLEATGVDHSQITSSTALPGASFMASLRGQDQPASPYLFWNLYGKIAVLYEGRWKLVANDYSEARERRGLHPPIRLFDLLNDPTETRNVAPEYPELTQQLLEEYEQWALLHDAVPFYKVREAYEENAGAARKERQKKMKAYLRKIQQDPNGESL